MAECLLSARIFDLNIISQATGLPLDSILELQENLHLGNQIVSTELPLESVLALKENLLNEP